jgi:hypothetical protein
LIVIKDRLLAVLNKLGKFFKQAADSGDTDRMLAAQEEMSKAYAESMVIKQQQQAWEEYNARLEAAGQTVEQHVPQHQQQYDPKSCSLGK